MEYKAVANLLQCESIVLQKIKKNSKHGKEGLLLITLYGSRGGLKAAAVTFLGRERDIKKYVDIF